MSHYCLAVFSKTGTDFDELLEPYDEENENYFEFVPLDKDEIEKYKEDFKKQYETDFEKYLCDLGYCRHGNIYGYMTNKQGYYDYYSLNGKDHLFSLKKDKQISHDETYHHISDYDLSNDNEQYKKSKRFYELYVDHLPLKPGESEPTSFFKEEYYRERYLSAENYAWEMSIPHPYAFVTSEGEWIAPGVVGWFGMSDETAKSQREYIKKWEAYVKAHPEEYVSFADCHI